MLAEIQKEMKIIKEMKRNDLDGARERWKALNERVMAYCNNNKLPDIWRKIILDELRNKENLR